MFISTMRMDSGDDEKENQDRDNDDEWTDVSSPKRLVRLTVDGIFFASNFQS